MTSMPERMATVEQKINAIEATVNRTSHNVDQLKTWMMEQRGAMGEKERSGRRDKAVLTGAAGLLGAVGGFLSDLFLGGPK